MFFRATFISSMKDLAPALVILSKNAGDADDAEEEGDAPKDQKSTKKKRRECLLLVLAQGCCGTFVAVSCEANTEKTMVKKIRKRENRKLAIVQAEKIKKRLRENRDAFGLNTPQAGTSFKHIKNKHKRSQMVQLMKQEKKKQKAKVRRSNGYTTKDSDLLRCLDATRRLKMLIGKIFSDCSPFCRVSQNVVVGAHLYSSFAVCSKLATGLVSILDVLQVFYSFALTCTPFFGSLRLLLTCGSET
eukprot:s121_g36.t1